MANEIVYSGLSDLRLAKMITQEIQLKLRDTQNLRTSGYLDYFGSINGTGSSVVSVRIAGLDGYDTFASPAEIAAGSNTALTDGSADITVARQFLAYEISDLANMTGFANGQDIDPFRLAASISASYETRFSALQSSTLGGLSTNTVGNATDAFSTDLFFNSIYKLERSGSDKGAAAPFAMVIHPKQLVELQDSLRNETSNSVAMMSATAEMLQAKGRGFVGSLFGVDVYKSSHVTDAAGAHLGYIISKGCLGYADGIPTNLPQAVDFMQMGKVLIEMERNGASALTKVMGHAYLGMAIINENKGCLIKSTT